MLVHDSRSKEILQPSFVRTRAAYRSPISSLRFNQDAEAFHYDIVTLYTNYGNILARTEEDNSVLFGDDFDPEGIDSSWSSYTGKFSFTELSLKLDKLNKRISLLEKYRS